MTARKTLREVLESDRLERERVRALIRDVDESLGKPEPRLGPLATLERAERCMQAYGGR